MFRQMFKIIAALSIAACCFGIQEETSSSSSDDLDISGYFGEATLVSQEKPKVSKATPKPKPVKVYPMGLQYRVTLCDEKCNLREVDSSQEFHSGERIRFSFNANTNGYLYVLHKGSSGDESVLFPSPEINNGSNKIKKRVQYPVPADDWFVFDENPGEEFIRVILSRHPLELLEKEIKKQVNLPQESKNQASSVMLVSASDQEIANKFNTRDLGLYKEASPLTKDAKSSVQSTIIVNLNPSVEKNELVYKDITLKHTSESAGARYGSMRARDLYLEGFKKPKQASAEQAAGPMALRYSVLKKLENGQFMTVNDLKETFHAGDNIRLRVEVNDSGYLYVVHRDPNGIWQPLFPAGDPLRRSNAVNKNEVYEIPSAGDNYRWVFDNEPGTERLYIVFSRQRQPNFEALLKSIGNKQTGSANPAKAPMPQKTDGGTVQLVSDKYLAMMNETHGRGIKVEIANEKESPSQVVPVAYVANPSVAPDALVITEMKLEHK